MTSDSRAIIQMPMINPPVITTLDLNLDIDKDRTTKELTHVRLTLLGKLEEVSGQLGIAANATGSV